MSDLGKVSCERCEFPGCSVKTAPGWTYCRGCRNKTASVFGKVPPNKLHQVLAERVGRKL